VAPGAIACDARSAPLKVILRGSALGRREDAASSRVRAAGTGGGRRGPGRGGRAGSGVCAVSAVARQGL